MNQLFVFLTFALVLAVFTFMPADYGRNLTSVNENSVCEKQLDDGVKIVSEAKRKYLPCWLEKQN